MLRDAAARGVLDVDQHERTVLVGDLHGDLMTLLAILEHSSLVHSLPDEVREQAFFCPLKHTPRATDAPMPMEPHQVKSIRWRGGSAAVVFLGDLLDSRRGDHHDEYGVCGMPGTQQTILSVLDHVQTQAREAGGRVMWVLGNHCCANVASHASHFAHSYAPRYFVSRSGAVASVANGPREFSSEWRALVKHYMTRLAAVPMLLVQVGGDPLALALHGFATRQFFEAADAESASDAATARRNVHRANELFEQALFDDRGPLRELLRDNDACLPTWCRASPGDARDDTTQRFCGCRRVIKAHDPQPSVGCHGDVCFTDMAMSRCFHTSAIKKGRNAHRLGYLEMNREGGITPRHFSASFEAR